LRRELSTKYRQVVAADTAQVVKNTGADWTRGQEALAHVGPRLWTAYGDLAELVGFSAQSIGSFVATGAPGGHRVLTTTDGTAKWNLWYQD